MKKTMTTLITIITILIISSSASYAADMSVIGSFRLSGPIAAEPAESPAFALPYRVATNLEDLISRQPATEFLQFDQADGTDACGYEWMLDDTLQHRPGLAGFFFGLYLNDDGDHYDIEVERIGAKAINYRQIEVEFSGDLDAGILPESCDPYSWKLYRQELPPGTVFPDPVIRTVSNSSGETIPLMEDDSLMPVLTGFRIERDDEHHLMRIMVRVYKGVDNIIYLDIACEDKNPAGDSFTYEVEYALVPEESIYDRGCETGYALGWDYKYVDFKNPVLQGFELDFFTSTKEDHQIENIGVIVRETGMDTGVAEVWYSDKNDDDTFDWAVWWVDVYGAY